MELQFIGASGTVTGSKYLLSTGNKHILIDCGLFQGPRRIRDRNWEGLPIRPQDIDCVILTHGHIDHTGYLPVLIKNGFQGPIYCTPGTADLCGILLPDSGHIQEEDAFFANKHGFSHHKPALPLYTRDEAVASLRFLKPIDFKKDVTLEPSLTFRFHSAGHILGAALIELDAQGKKIVFTGDLGRPNDLLMNPPAPMEQADYLIMESTYGDRLHGTKDPLDALAETINRTTHRGGVVVIPAFAVGRAQAILYLLHELKVAKRIEDIPIYLDSPMAVNASELYCKYGFEHRLSIEKCNIAFGVAKYINTPDESKALDQEKFPKVIISASGMATGGRVMHHLKAFLPDHRNTVIFTGFQAPESMGEAISHGKQEVKIHGEMVPVEAEIVFQDTLSAHADYQELLGWLSNFKSAPKRVFLTHGEPDGANALKTRIIDKFHWDVHIPDYLERVSLP